MLLPKFYPPKNPELRRHNKFIVLSHISNFPLRSHSFPPDLRNRADYYCLNEIQEYYREKVEVKNLPFHYYTSRLRKDWQLFTTAPMDWRSPIIDKAAENYYIEDRFKDAVIICVQDNFSLTIPDERMYQMLSAQLISPLISQFRTNFRDSVFWFDEIFDWERYERDKALDPLNMRYPYEVQKMTFFDRTIFNLETIKFLR